MGSLLYPKMEWKLRWIVSVLVLLGITFECYSQSNVSVTITKGQVVGLRWDPNPRSQASYDAFLGIPYGKIPGRFQPAVPRDKWNTALTAQTDGPMCPQPGAPFSEDCLYLNVFTPLNASSSPGVYPVIAYIHGSAFTAGSSASAIYGPDFIVPQGVVLVTMNYRMGATGFLTLGCPQAPGNLGLLDTRLALQWVQQEIAVFGGDPGKVTLAGQSAGSAMVTFHYLTAASADMIQRAIAHSGSALATWSHVTASEGVRRAKLLADAVGCDSGRNTTEILKCLQVADIHSIVNYQSITLPVESVASGNQLPFVPVIDTSYGNPAFFEDSLENLIKNASVRAKPLVTGFTTEEGIMLLGMSTWKLAEANLRGFVPRKIQNSLDGQQRTSLAKSVKNKYFPDSVEQNKVWDIVKLYTDYLFAYPAIDMITSLPNITYGYVFTYDGTWAAMPDYVTERHFHGVFHGADLYYLFYGGQDLGHCASNLPNLAVRDYMVKWWTSFAKNGIPDLPELWGTASSGNYRLFSTEVTNVNASVVRDLHYDFWNNMTASGFNNAATQHTNWAFMALFLVIPKLV